MPADIIDRIHQLARRNCDGIEFADRDGVPFLDPTDSDDDDDDDASYDPDDDSSTS
jgi:hypothetical protein